MLLLQATETYQTLSLSVKHGLVLLGVIGPLVRLLDLPARPLSGLNIIIGVILGHDCIWKRKTWSKMAYDGLKCILNTTYFLMRDCGMTF